MNQVDNKGVEKLDTQNIDTQNIDTQNIDTQNIDTQNIDPENQNSKKKPVFYRVFRIFIAAIALIVLIIGGYLGYVIFSYDRLEDNILLDVAGCTAGNTLEVVNVDESYSIMTFNIGYGAYNSDYTFFMDGGKESRARSQGAVIESIDDCVYNIEKKNPDIVFLQEVDTDSTRSLHVNEYERIINKLPDYCSVFANNYHSAYLMYPVWEPIGASNSGIQTLSKFDITSSIRRQLPISNSFSKLLDLDRCYSISRVPTSNGKELVLINVHLSAYGSSDDLKERQINMVMNDIKEEYDKGNYVICGGDFNADFTGDSVHYFNGQEQEVYGWTMPLDDSLVPTGIIKCDNYTINEMMPTVRNNDVPYEFGNFVAIVDGFFVTDNIRVDYLENMQLVFAYSDHNPVYMEFTLE